MERLLTACFTDDPPVPATHATASLVRAEDFDVKVASVRRPATGISIFPYRVDVNRVMRPVWSAVGSRDGQGHLPIDLHMLLTPWGKTPDDELRVLGRAMQCLETTPILSGPLLDSSGGWATGDAVQMVLGEITIEEIMRTFESLPGDYKLSVPYVARVIRIDTGARTMVDVTTAAARMTPTIPG